jgi:hypothetical protein
MTCTFYSLGLMGLALVTTLVHDWFMLSLVTSVPFLLYFFYILVMPESPRWLLAKGKLEDALKVLETMARVNGKEFPESFHRKLEERVLQEKHRKTKRVEHNIGALDLCKYGKNFARSNKINCRMIFLGLFFDFSNLPRLVFRSQICSLFSPLLLVYS